MKKILLVVLMLMSITSVCFGQNTNTLTMSMICGKSTIKLTMPSPSTIEENDMHSNLNAKIMEYYKKLNIENAFFYKTINVYDKGVMFSIQATDYNIEQCKKYNKDFQVSNLISFDYLYQMFKDNSNYTIVKRSIKDVTINGIKAKEIYCKFVPKEPDRKDTLRFARAINFYNDHFSCSLVFFYIDENLSQPSIENIINSIEIK